MARHPHPRLLALTGVLFGFELAAQTPAVVDFAREVLPILSNKCFVCHGPDSKKKDLVRLDSYTGATRDLGEYRAIDPAAPKASRILARIHDADDPMPPESSGKSLTDAERDVLRRWVEGGGQYAAHWAFTRPRKTPPPDLAQAGHPIDAFVRAPLRADNLELARVADPRTLARRVALVLTGLPPEPEVLRGFLNDRDSDAYGRLVDRLLKDPRFGEHQARYWLDAVRYGDTHGLHLDNRRGIYPYRDWVVHAFNHDLPLDDFIEWQLAGDLLPDPTLEQLVATGFVRMNPTTAEGGAIPAEFQAKNNFDRTESFGTVMLGMTMTCARCHTHKYDPITQTEYYELLAFFNSTAESPMDGNRYTYAPILRAPADQKGWSEWSEAEKEMREVVALANLESPAEVALQTHGDETSKYRAHSFRVSKPVARAAQRPTAGDWQETKKLPGVIGNLKVGRRRAVWVEFQLDAPVDQTLWLQISGGRDSKIWLDGESFAMPPTQGEDHHGMKLPLPLPAGKHELAIRLTGTRDKAPVEVRLTNPWTALSSKRWKECGTEDRLFMIADPNGPFAKHAAHDRARSLADRLAEIRLGFTTTLVAKERTKPRQTRVLFRGEYNMPTGDPVTPGVMDVMGALQKGAPENRLGLARWLTSRDHPLVARVLINRIWQRTFGHGLVRTPEDFGLQGEQPTHPELLDWLAVDLQDSGWNLKHMLRLMVTSQTFRQDSAWRQNIDDPENRRLARGPSHRLDAEVIRDIALWASGLLDKSMGGEGIKPYQPPGMWSALAHPASNTKRYVPGTGPRLYRRSLYVYWKRTSPHPMMTLFDAPSRETSCVRRSRTSTPLQSLGLLNESQRLEMARAMAERLLRSARSDTGRLRSMFLWLVCREPNRRELTACQTLLQTMRRRYSATPADAAALLERSGGAGGGDFEPAELAAWSQVAITVLASDITILLY